MIDLQKAGGIAAIAMGLAYVLGFGLFATVLDPGGAAGGSEAVRLDFLLQRRGLMQAVMLVIYVGFGAALVVLTAALHDRLRRHHAGLMAVASVFGHLWAGLVIASGMVASIGLDRVASLHGTARRPTRPSRSGGRSASCRRRLAAAWRSSAACGSCWSVSPRAGAAAWAARPSRLESLWASLAS